MTKPRYYAMYRDQKGWHNILWNVRTDGKPTLKSAERKRRQLNESFATPKGANWHVSRDCGYIIHVSALRIMRQCDDMYIVQSNAPLFEVV